VFCVTFCYLILSGVRRCLSCKMVFILCSVVCQRFPVVIFEGPWEHGKGWLYRS